MKNLLRRLISSACLVGLVLAALFYLPLWAFSLALGGFITLGLLEFFVMAKQRGLLVNVCTSVVIGVIFTALVAWRAFSSVEYVVNPTVLDFLGTSRSQAQSAASLMWDIFWPAIIVVIFLRQIARENTFEALSGLATTLFGLAYIPALLSYIFYIRALDIENGANLVCYLILVTKMADAGAYAFGKMFGKHPLAPRISPKKTVEGLIGALFVSALTAVLAEPLLGHTIGIWTSIIYGVVLGAFGTLGDLSESVIKRDCQVKDTGTGLPGLGGVLDVLDSLIFTAPIFYWILNYTLY